MRTILTALALALAAGCADEPEEKTETELVCHDVTLDGCDPLSYCCSEATTYRGEDREVVAEEVHACWYILDGVQSTCDRVEACGVSEVEVVLQSCDLL